MLNVCSEPAFTKGEFYGLNHANLNNPYYGRLDDEHCSGRWLYSFLRRDAKSGQAFLIVVNLHPSETLPKVQVQIPEHAIEWLARLPNKLTFTDQLGSNLTAQSSTEDLITEGLPLGNLAPKATLYLQLK